MSVYGKTGSLFLRFVHWLFKQSGINGVLIVVILIEIPILGFYFIDSSEHFIIGKNYRIQQLVDCKEISIDDLPADKKEYASDFRHYLYATVQIDNYYYQDTLIPSLEAEDPAGDFLYFSEYDYYADLEEIIPFYRGYHLRATIPAGTSVYATYLMEISDYDIDNIDTITIYSLSDHLMYDSEEREYEAGRRITVPFIYH